MSNYSAYFLNSGSNVVQLELIEIRHPSFSRLFQLVRNAIAGVTVTLEDASVKTFDYYPLQIQLSGAGTDLDQSLQLVFGDLGTILPLELDRMLVQSKVTVNGGAVVGAWVDNTGQLVAKPFLIGNGGFFFAPLGATKLQVGMNDSFYSDNQIGSPALAININGGGASNITPTNKPWTYVSGGLNAAYPYTATGATGPVQRTILVGVLNSIVITGLAGLSPGATLYGGAGDPNLGSAVGSPGALIETEPKPASYVRPIVIYRTYRSDDLTQPLYGPFYYQVDNISFDKQGATMSCSVPRLNTTATGEIYTLDRFSMLRGFI